MNQRIPTEFEEASSAPQSGLLSEFVHFLAHNKKFWLLPILAALLLVGTLLMLGGTAAAPFVYTLF